MNYFSVQLLLSRRTDQEHKSTTFKNLTWLVSLPQCFQKKQHLENAGPRVIFYL